MNKQKGFRTYVFYFEDLDMMYRFIKLYEDLFMSYECRDETVFVGLNGMVKVKAEHGVIPKIKKGMGNLIQTRHAKYYVRKAA